MAHMHYKGTGQTHSFRGLLADGEQDKIRIEGATGEIAWRITKFAILQKTPGAALIEAVMKIYREEQDTVDGNIDFTDAELLAAGFQADYNTTASTINQVIIFDNSLFRRNIFVTFKDISNDEACNYYIELEEVKVSAASMAQLAVAAARRVVVTD